MLKPKKLTQSYLSKIFKLRDAFVEAHRGFKLYEYQRGPSNEIIRSVLQGEGKTILIEYSRQSGKTECVALTICFLLLYMKDIMLGCRNIKVDDFSVGLFAPLQEQAKTAFDKIKYVLNKDEIRKAYGIFFNEANGNTVKLMNNTVCYCFSASPTSYTESKTMHLIIIDEAQLVDDGKINNTILPMGTNTNATVVYIGTSGYKKCKFLDMLERPMIGQKKFIYSFKEIVRQKAMRYYESGDELELNYYKFIKNELGKIGVKIRNPQELIDLDIDLVDSDAFKTQYGLIWMLEKGQYITTERLKFLEGDYEIKTGGRDFEVYVGVDFGKMHDSTVVTVGDTEGNIIAWKEMKGDDYDTQFLAILEFLSHFKVKSICCDATATQDMMVDRFKKAMSNMSVSVIGVNFGTLNSQLYKNMDFMMKPVYNTSGDKVSEALLRFPKTDCIQKEKFIKQFLDLQKEVNNKGVWSCKAPEGANYFDDYCDSCALYLWNFSFYEDIASNVEKYTATFDESIAIERKIRDNKLSWEDKLSLGYLKKIN